MFRERGEIPQLFSGNEEADQRYMFFTDGQTRDLEKIDDQSNGYFVEKWTNLFTGFDTFVVFGSLGINFRIQI